MSSRSGNCSIRPAGPRRGAPAFTLVEVLLAVFILTLVVTSVYFTLYSAMEAFHAGVKMKDQYQEMRAGLSNMLSDLRQSASANQFWKDYYQPEPLLDEEGNALPDDRERNEERGKIKFVGDAGSVSFVRKEMVPLREQPYDLIEVKYSLDRERRALQRTRTRSVLAEQMVIWRENYLSLLLETDFRDMLPDPQYDEHSEDVLRNVTGLRFAYFDGEEWVDSWDSTDPLFPPEEEYDPDTGNPTPTPDPNMIEKGLPAAVEVKVDFVVDTRSSRRTRGDQELFTRSLITRTYLPHSNLNMAETPFERKGQSQSKEGSRRERRSQRRSEERQ
jgi:hypothetical protein